jgi:hypothetical protein
MSLFCEPLAVTLNAAERKKFWAITPEGDGGPQRLWTGLSRRLTQGKGTLTLEDEELLKIRRYGFNYADSGGYQGAFQAIVYAARRAGWDEPDGDDQHPRQPKHKGRRWDGK